MSHSQQVRDPILILAACADFMSCFLVCVSFCRSRLLHDADTVAFIYPSQEVCNIYFELYTWYWLMQVNVFPSRPSVVGMNMSLSTVNHLFQFNISLYQYLIVFCFGPHFVDIRSDHVSSGRSGSFRLLVSELSCSVQHEFLLTFVLFSQLGRDT